MVNGHAWRILGRRLEAGLVLLYSFCIGRGNVLLLIINLKHLTEAACLFLQLFYFSCVMAPGNNWKVGGAITSRDERID